MSIGGSKCFRFEASKQKLNTLKPNKAYSNSNARSLLANKRLFNLIKSLPSSNNSLVDKNDRLKSFAKLRFFLKYALNLVSSSLIRNAVSTPASRAGKSSYSASLSTGAFPPSLYLTTFAKFDNLALSTCIFFNKKPFNLKLSRLNYNFSGKNTPHYLLKSNITP